MIEKAAKLRALARCLHRLEIEAELKAREIEHQALAASEGRLSRRHSLKRRSS